MLDELLSDRDVEKATGRARSTCKWTAWPALVFRSSASAVSSVTGNRM
jgi:hypothetical protein